MRYVIVAAMGLLLAVAPALSQQEGHLQSGSDPSVLPGPVLIADEDNDRIILVDPQGRVVWTFPETGDLQPGETFKTPDDAFYTPDGKQIIVTHEENFAVSLVDIASRRIVWHYGTPGAHGHGPNQLWNPDDALVLPDGHVLIPDIKNCRILLIARGTQTPERIFGANRRPPGGCRHDPPRIFGSPNGAFPMRNGHYLVTEIQGAWHSELDVKAGAVVRSFRVPGVRYPSDSNEIEPGRYITADYSKPGQLVMFDGDGKVLWRYKPTGKDALDHPSLAKVLPNGMVIANDDSNHRVIVVDPKTNRIVWQYGQTGRKGREPGLLNTPDGVDLAPPHSLLIVHKDTMGMP
ncbi:MAG TPA: PQQ-binding-like beta-propeller repeat protein [Terriglobales bacterium]|nr:PQQ-binding-like beta-propeller repeat protein [Terriglobales bacterium]